MNVRNVYLQYGWFDFIEISKEDYERHIRRRGWDHHECVNLLSEEPFTRWTIFICFPKRYSSERVIQKFNEHYTMFTGIV